MNSIAKLLKSLFLNPPKPTQPPPRRPISLNNASSQLTRQAFNRVKDTTNPAFYSLDVHQTVCNSIFHRKVALEGRQVRPHFFLNCLLVPQTPEYEKHCYPSVGGSYLASLISEHPNYLFPNISITVHSKYWPIPKPYLSDLYWNIFASARHEIEHAQQPDEMTQYNLQHNTDTTSLDYWEHYFLQPAEVEAFAVAIYTQAKRQHTSFLAEAEERFHSLRLYLKCPDGACLEDHHARLDLLCAHVFFQWTSYINHRFPAWKQYAQKHMTP